MSWQAANVPRHQTGHESSGSRKSSKDPSSRRRGETVEAVLSRLSKAYSLSMECLGAMHTANAAILKQQKKDFSTTDSTNNNNNSNNNNETEEESQQQQQALQKVARAARDTLERAVLMDPLVMEHAPTLRYAIQSLAAAAVAAAADRMNTTADKDNSDERWKALCRPRPEPPKISSKAHRSTIRQLTYLALTNYADLLLSVCTCYSLRTKADAPVNLQRTLIIDRGVINKLQGFQNQSCCCWNQDSEEDIQRLALCALCDASALDGSDPVVWLKLACAARAMGRLHMGPLDNPVLSPFRRLERHALENGLTALPPNVPMNRIIQRMWNDFHLEAIPESYPPTLAPEPEQCKLNLDLTRYSWSLLGRLLMKVVRQGTEADDGLRLAVTSKNAVPFGSPVVTLRLSPMLRLPTRALMGILSFLEESSIWKFEATCRALSVSIMSARAAMEQQEGKVATTAKQPSNEEKADVVVEPVQQNPDSLDRTGDENYEGETVSTSKAAMSATKSTILQDEPTRAGRSSKRVRSQQITSDKREERLRKRKSVGFCLRAATLSCTRDDANLKSCWKESFVWDKINGELWKLPASLDTAGSSTGKGKLTSAQGARHQFEASERIGPSSFSYFLQRLSSQNAGPSDLLHQYLGHVAVHVEEVFLVDPGDAMVLNSSITECFELLLQQQKFQDEMIPHFLNRDAQNFASLSSEQALKLYAMDLLNVELVFRACERQNDFNVSFDSDSNYVSCMIPILLDGMSSIDKTFADTHLPTKRLWIKIKARVNWLVAGVFLWRSKLTRCVSESIEAEEQGLKYLDSAITCLSLPENDPVSTVATPHLVSLGRTGAHWKTLSYENLSTYRDEIQAASVVSHAQQQFQERVESITKRQRNSPNEYTISDEDISGLLRIGETLLARYTAEFGDKECKHGELLENFMSMHGDKFSSANWDDAGNSTYDSLCQAIPSNSLSAADFGSDVLNPSILSILVTCLQANVKNHRRVAELLVRLLLSALDRYEQLCRAITNKKPASDSPDVPSDSDDDDESLPGGYVDGDSPSSQQPGPIYNAMKYGRFIKFVLDRVVAIVLSFADDSDKAYLGSSAQFQQVLHHCLAMSSSWIDNFTHQPTILEEKLDLNLFKSIQKLFCLMRQGEDGKHQNLTNLFFSGLVRIIEAQRKSFQSLVRVQGAIRAGRAVRQRLCILRAEFIGTVFCELGDLLSKHLFRVEAGKILRSQLFATTGDQNESRIPLKLAILCEEVVWFCDYTRLSAVQTGSDPMSSFDRPIADRLLVPLAVAVVSICGSGSSSRLPLTNKFSGSEIESLANEGSHNDQLCLEEFLDSDASAHELSDDEGGDGLARARKESLRVLCHVVHCVGLVFGNIGEKQIISFDTSEFYATKDGPLLPLVVARVLNYVADNLLVEYEDDSNRIRESEEKGIWSRSYPFGTGGIGALLDSALYKAYRCLHGFTLTNSGDEYSTKEHLSTTTSEFQTKKFKPESHKAAAQLYRCIFRMGKKTPPKAALETVTSALPPLRQSEKSKLIRQFVFSSNTKLFLIEDIASIVTKTSNWTKHFEDIEKWEQTETTEGNSEPRNDSIDDEVFFMRKGIFLLLSQGDLPTYTADGGKDEDRSSSIRFEKELAKKFNAILNTICFAETYSIRAWFRASQCLLSMHEVVSDRLGLSKGFSRSRNFGIPQGKPPAVSRLSITSLIEKQEKESLVKEMGWIEFLGEDLSHYVNHEWTSFESLQMLSQKNLVSPAGIANQVEDEAYVFMGQIQKEIDDMYSKGRFGEWQQAWGGMFVSALRKIAIRCMCVAVFLFHERKARIKKEDESLLPEVLESLGTILYASVMGSQSYGYPMHVMGSHDKRRMVQASRVCFQGSVDAAIAVTDDGKAETWDLLFMIGKVRFVSPSMRCHHIPRRYAEICVSFCLFHFSSATKRSRARFS